jgi:hypothetical protein
MELSLPFPLAPVAFRFRALPSLSGPADAGSETEESSRSSISLNAPTGPSSGRP